MSGSITLENRFGVNKMELISLKYAIFVIVLLVLYYCFPKENIPVAKVRIAAEELYKIAKHQ